MDCYRIDFWDKLVISITLVIVTFFCVCSNLVFADTTLVKGVLEKCNLSNGVIVEGNINIIYYELISGHSYKIKSNRDDVDLTLRFCDEKPAYGVEYYDTLQLPILSTIDFSFSSDNRILFVILPVGSNLDSFSVIDVSNCQQIAISSLVYNVSPQRLWSIFGKAVPYIAVVTLVGFGFYLIFHNIKEISNGKERM